MQPLGLGERFLLAVHDPFTGAPEAARGLMESGLVAADVADLVVAGRLGLVPDGIIVRTPGARGADPIGDYVVDHVAGQEFPQDLATWIELIGGALFELHVRNLVEQAVVRRERRRGLLGRVRERYPAVDLLRAADPLLRLRHTLRNPHELDLEGGILACIVVGIEGRALLELDQQDEICAHIHAQLPDDLRALMDQLGEAVTSIGLSRS